MKAKATFGFGVSKGEATPADDLTTMMGERLWFTKYNAASVPVGDSPNTYLQFASGTDLALALVETLNLIGAVPAAIALVLEVLEHKNLTVENALKGCPAAPAGK
jgi:hypothetical protein